MEAGNLRTHTDGTGVHTMLAKHTACKLRQVIGPYLRSPSMNQIFLRSALNRSRRLGVSAWTLHIARAYDWELGIVAALYMSHLGNVFSVWASSMSFFLPGRPSSVLLV